MKEKALKIEAGKKYLSEVEGFELPNGILDKQTTGCGGTTLALECKYNYVICSPRVSLLENKAAQYNNTLFVRAGVKENQIKSYIQEKIESGEPYKILTTYDSFEKVKKSIESINEVRVLVDEFQLLLADSAFKSEVEMNFINALKDFSWVTYMSATPILGKYLEQMEIFKDKDFIKLDWADKEHYSIKRVKCNSIQGAALDIIKRYKSGNFPTIGDNISNEAVFYLNSVTDIVNIIKQSELLPDEVNIIVADNEQNKELIKKLGNRFSRGRVPLRGEQHKMFTFCTSTAFAGVDFYSTCASTFVFSNPNYGHTMVDISTELVQIAGRQRLSENPFKHTIRFYYCTNKLKDNEAEYLEQREAKVRASKVMIHSFNNTDRILWKTLLKGLACTPDDYYVYFDKETDELKFNDYAYLVEDMIFNIRHHIYKNGLFIMKEIQSTGKFNIQGKQDFCCYDYLDNAVSHTSFEDRMKQYIELKEKLPLLVEQAKNRPDDESNLETNARAYEIKRIEQAINHIILCKPTIATYYEDLGAARIKALNYKEANLKQETLNNCNAAKVEYYLKQSIKDGDRITLKQLKTIVADAYIRACVNKIAKATDIADYGFKLKQCLITSTSGRDRGFSITYIK